MRRLRSRADAVGLRLGRPIPRRMPWLLLLVGLALGPTAFAQGEGRAPPPSPPAAAGAAALDEPVEAWLNGVLFKIPAGYLWPSAHRWDETMSRIGLEVRSLMPSRRHPGGRDDPRLLWFPPGDGEFGGEFLVGAQLSPLRKAGEGAERMAFKYGNLIGAEGEERYEFEPQANLQRFRSKTDPTEPIHYRTTGDFTPGALISCAPPEKTFDQYDLCGGTVFYEADKMALASYSPGIGWPNGKRSRRRPGT